MGLDGIAANVAHQLPEKHGFVVGEIVKINSSQFSDQLNLLSLRLMKESKMDNRCSVAVDRLQSKIERIRDLCLSNKKKGINVFFTVLNDDCVTGLIDEFHACSEAQTELGQQYQDTQAKESLSFTIAMDMGFQVDDSLREHAQRTDKAAPFFRRIEEIKNIEENNNGYDEGGRDFKPR